MLRCDVLLCASFNCAAADDMERRVLAFVLTLYLHILMRSSIVALTEMQLTSDPS